MNSKLISVSTVDLTKIDLATEEDRTYNIDKWARLFKAKTWEEIHMLAAQNTIFEDAATTVRKLTEDEKIRIQCEAREDHWRRETALRRRLSISEENCAQKDRIIAEQEKRIAELEAIVKKHKNM